MKRFRLFIFITLFAALLPLSAFAAENPLEAYVAGFNYEARKEMKVSSTKLLDLLEDGKAVLVDIRFREEQQAWGPASR